MDSRPWPLGSLLLLSAAVFVSVTTELLPTGLLPAMSRDLGVSEGQVGLLVTAYALMVAVLAAPIGVVTARYGRRTLLTVAMILYAVCSTVTAVSDSYPLTVAGRLVGGFSHGLFWGMLAGYAGRLVSPDRVGRAVAITLTGGTSAVVVGVPLGTAIGVAAGWRVSFAGLAAVAAILALIAARRLPRIDGTADGHGVRMRDVLRQPALAAVITATALIMLGQFSFSTYVAPFLTHAGLAESQLAPALFANGLAGVLGLVLAGLLVDRALRAATVAAGALLAVTFVVLTLGGTAAAVAVAANAALGLAMGMLPLFLQAAALRAAPDAHDPASALNAAAFNVGIAGGALLGGISLDRFGPAALPLVAAALTSIGLAVTVASRRVGRVQNTVVHPSRPAPVHNTV